MTLPERGGNPPETRRIINVQCIRAIAALLVVFAHLDTMLKSMGMPPFGYGGVDLFFVVSGFIMVFTTLDKGVSPIDFMTNRIARIVPFYWLLTLAVFLIAVVKPSFVQATNADLIPLIKSLLFIPFVKSNGLMMPDLFVGWTLNYEMFFYVLFAVGLAAHSYMRGLTGVIIVLICLAVYGAVAPPHNAIVAFYTSPLMLEFGMGMVIGLIHHRIPQRTSVYVAVITIAAVLVAFEAIVLAPLVGPVEPSLLFCGVPAVIVLLGTVALERWSWILANRPLVALGNASYSIYLTHLFVTRPFEKIVTHFQMTGFASTMLMALTLITVCAAGWVVHVLIERPLSAAARRALA